MNIITMENTQFIKYSQFLTELYNISKKDTFSLSKLIKEYKVSTTISKVLLDNNYIIKVNKTYKWNTTKPLKPMVYTVLGLLKDANKKTKVVKKIDNTEFLSKITSLEQDKIDLLTIVDETTKSYNSLLHDFTKVNTKLLNVESDLQISNIKKDKLISFFIDLRNKWWFKITNYLDSDLSKRLIELTNISK